MARKLGFKPRTLIANIPNKAEPWKAPVAVWVRELYEKHQRRAEQRRKRRERAVGSQQQQQEGNVETRTGGVC